MTTPPSPHYARIKVPPILLVAAFLAALPLAGGFLRANAADAPARLKITGDEIERLLPYSLDSASIYVVGKNGLYKGDQSGSNWEHIANQIPPGAIVPSIDGADLMLAGAHQGCGRGGGGTPLNRSTDGGATWKAVPRIDGLQPLAIWGKADLALAADCGGPQVSTDGGQTWTRITGIQLGREVTAFATVDGISERKVLLGVTGEGGTSQLYEVDLTDPTHISVSPPLKQYFAKGALAGYKQERVLAGPDGVWLSIDEGQNWALRANGLANVVLSVDPLTQAIPPAEAKRGFGLSAIALNPSSTSRMVVGSVNGAFVTKNAGASWQQIAGIKGAVPAIAVVDLGGTVLIQTENGVVVTHPWS